MRAFQKRMSDFCIFDEEPAGCLDFGGYSTTYFDLQCFTEKRLNSSVEGDSEIDLNKDVMNTPMSEEIPDKAYQQPQDDNDVGEFGPLVVDIPSNNIMPPFNRQEDETSLNSLTGHQIEHFDHQPDHSSIAGSDLGSSRGTTPNSRLSPTSNVNSLLSGRRGRKILPVECDDGNSKYKCPVCDKELETSHDLTVHIRSHNSTNATNTSNTCTICGKTLSSQSSLDRHMLVHSGERPFKCKICKMAFTTNGNMHRHSRIHAKDGDASGMSLSRGRRTKATWKPQVFQESEFDMLRREEYVPQNITPKKPLMSPQFIPSGLKRPIPQFAEWYTSPYKKPKINEFSPVALPTIPPTIPTMPLWINPPTVQVKEMPEQIVNEDKGVVSEKIPERDTDDKELNCHICGKGFLCKYGLESHLEMHPNYRFKCDSCELSFQTKRGLRLHQLMVHSVKEKSDNESDGNENEETDVVSGFYDLCFTDFSMEKFSHISKSWCEKNPRRPISDFHDFTCQKCSRSFPTKTALALHMNSHSPEKMLICPICDTDFSDKKLLHHHMLKHMSEKAFEDSQEILVENETDISEKITKPDFLAMFDLKPTNDCEDDIGSKERRIFTFEHLENNDYFRKLDQNNPSSDVPENGKIVPKDYSDIQEMFSAASNLANFSTKPENFMFPYMAQMHPAFSAMPSFFPMISPYMMPNIKPKSVVSTPPSSSIQHQNSFSTNPSSPLSVSSGSEESNSSLNDSSTSLNSKDVNGISLWQCNYCDMTFTNHRAWKGHTRTHLGLAPYKCNLCNYSSADKSTLIRHLRTHNGERPFQCLICDFAFTTKANCERHVRKKHGKDSKEDIELSIGYNKFASDTTSNVTSFHSPDTVCKYCGIDFKFFRALKHHLRSHSSCRQKPYMCRICDIGFSTKANSVRHIQRQHVEIPLAQIEQFIQINEPNEMEDGEEDIHENDDNDEYYDEDEEMSGILFAKKASTPVKNECSEKKSLQRPPVAHSSAQKSSLKDLEVPKCVKIEPQDYSMEQPLDFSMKSSKPMMEPAHNQLPTSVIAKDNRGSSDNDQPMDLSIKKTSPLDAENKNKIRNNLQITQWLESNSHFQCKFCPMGFSSPSILHKHIKNHHRHDQSNLSQSHGQMGNSQMMSPFLSNKLPVKPPMMISAFQFNQSKGIFHAKPVRNPKPSKPISSNRNTVSSNSGLDSNCDLASVHKMIDATNAQNFQGFFQSAESMESLMNMHARSKVSKQLFESDNEMQDDENDCKGFDLDGDDSNDEQHVKDGNAMMSNRYSQFIVQHESLRQKELQESIDSPSDQLNSSSESAKHEEKSDEKLVKKKRNSYADSPHKLQCPYCPRSFPWASSLQRHLMTHTGQKPFKCPRCPVTFSTKSNRERHLIRKHGVNMLDPASRQTMDRPFKCHMCVFSSFSTHINLLKHYKERHPGCALPDTLKDIMMHGGLDKLSGSDMESEEAKALDQSYNENDDMSDEENSNYDDCENNVLDDEEAEEKIDIKSISGLNADIDDSETNINQDNCLDVSDMSRQLDMTDLSRTFTGSAERHLNPERDNYNVDKIKDCWKCGETFMSRKLLVRHLKEHSIDLPYKCYLCDASFGCRFECLHHQAKIHTSDWVILKEKNHVDDIEFFSKHMDILIDKVLKTDLEHINVVELQDIIGGDDIKMDTFTADYTQRKVYCSLCPKRFWSLQDLRRHMRSHTGERPFECDLCQKRFTLKHSMMRHRKKHQDAGPYSGSDDEDSLHGDEMQSKVIIRPNRNALRYPIGNLPVTLPETINLSMKQPPISKADLINVLRRQSRQGESEETEPDALHNLLGVDMASLENLLDTPADTAARLLGVMNQ